MRSQTLTPVRRECNRVLHFLTPPREIREFRFYSGEKFFLIRPNSCAGLWQAVALALTCGHVTGHAGQACGEGLLLQSDSCSVTHSRGYRGTALDQECAHGFWGERGMSSLLPQCVLNVSHRFRL